MDGMERLGFWTKETTFKMAYILNSKNAKENWIIS